MITIPIQVSGDAWNNRKEVEEILSTISTDTKITLDLHSEGPSLYKLGLVELFQNYQDVTITKWANNVELVPFEKYMCSFESHFYPHAKSYWRPQWPGKIDNVVLTDFRFGLFLGRSTISRNRILYDASTKWHNNFLISKLRNTSTLSIWDTNPCSLELFDEWFDDIDCAQEWFNKCQISSLDNHTIQDQYRIPEVSSAKLALSLLEFYKKFNVELVCESYTLGTTFFPTEKTVRPIVGNRPFIVYGPVNFLQNLKTQEGFKTFDHLWDESYDRLEGRARWDAITKLVDNLTALDNTQWNEIIKEASVITAHNQVVLRKIINDRQKL